MQRPQVHKFPIKVSSQDFSSVYFNETLVCKWFVPTLISNPITNINTKSGKSKNAICHD